MHAGSYVATPYFRRRAKCVMTDGVPESRQEATKNEDRECVRCNNYPSNLERKASDRQASETCTMGGDGIEYVCDSDNENINPKTTHPVINAGR
jgi:hypothetical protein